MSMHGWQRLAALAASAVFTGAVAGVVVGAGPAVAATAVASGGTSAGGGDAGADAGSGAVSCTPATFATAQQALESALAGRASELAKLATRVAQATDLPASDASTLQGIITAEQTTIDGGGIPGLQSAVPGEATCTDLVATARAMVQDFRVYALVERQVNITLCSNGTEAAVTKGTDAEAAISARIAQAGQAGQDTSGAQQAFADYEAQLSSAAQALGQVDVATLLAQVPSDFPGDQSMLSGDATAMNQAGTDLQAAWADLHTIQQDLS